MHPPNHNTSSIAELSASTAAVIAQIELPDKVFGESLRGFVASKMLELSQGVSKSEVTDTSLPFKEFIPSDRPMWPAIDVWDQRPFVLDNTSVYENTIMSARHRYLATVERLGPERALLNAAVRSSFEAQALFFGSYFGNTMQRLNRLEYADESATPGSISVTSIGKAAMCMERAAVVHNSLLVMGVSSTYCLGRLETYDENGKLVTSAGHAFLEIDGLEGKRYLYDPTRPVVTETQEENNGAADPNVHLLEGGANGYRVPIVRKVMSAGGVTETVIGTGHYYKNTVIDTLAHIATA